MAAAVAVAVALLACDLLLALALTKRCESDRLCSRSQCLRSALLASPRHCPVAQSAVVGSGAEAELSSASRSQWGRQRAVDKHHIVTQQRHSTATHHQRALSARSKREMNFDHRATPASSTQRTIKGKAENAKRARCDIVQPSNSAHTSIVSVTQTSQAAPSWVFRVPALCRCMLARRITCAVSRRLRLELQNEAGVRLKTGIFRCCMRRGAHAAHTQMVKRTSLDDRSPSRGCCAIVEFRSMTTPPPRCSLESFFSQQLRVGLLLFYCFFALPALAWAFAFFASSLRMLVRLFVRTTSVTVPSLSM